jgi:predicted O-methyltransferase YrrM
MNPSERLQQIKQNALQEAIPIISDEGLEILSFLISKHQVHRVLEIGTAVGYCAIALCLAHPVQVTTIERNESMLQKAKAHIAQCMMESRITLIQGDAQVVDLLDPLPFDLLFIDAAKAQYQNFFEKFSPLVKVGGIVVCDNLSFHGFADGTQVALSRDLKQLVRKINRFKTWLFSQDAWETSFLSTGDGMSISIKK